MKRIFKVVLSRGHTMSRQTFEVVAPTAREAIGKAEVAAAKQTKQTRGWIVEELYHRGRAV